MTPQEVAESITGAKDVGGICTPNSPMGRSRQIAQAIQEAVDAERERCAKIAETTYAKDALHFELGWAIAKAIREQKD